MAWEKHNFWRIWALVSLASFLAFFIGVRYVLNSSVTIQNIIFYLVAGVIFGAICAALYLLRLKIAAATFVAGIAFGFFDMYRTFWSDMNGWEDLAGFMSLFLWMGVGLTIGSLAEIAKHFFFRYKNKNK